MNIKQPKKILIVEDEPDTAEMLAEMIKLIGFSVLKSYGGNSAIELAHKEKPDGIILDIMMPDMSGLEVLRTIRKDPTLDDIPVILVSGRNLQEDVRSGLEGGAVEYLIKPIAYQDLRDVLIKATTQRN